VHVAGTAGVAGIYATEFNRTQETVEPLASAMGLPVVEVAGSDVAGLVTQCYMEKSTIRQ
jgi:broad specificity phosphatase PhoE